MKSLHLFLVLIVIVVKCFANNIKQEGATINYCNPKYVTDCYAITRRTSRREPHRSNFTANFRYSMGNNTTIKVELLGGIKVEIVKTRLCDAKNIEWLYEFLQLYSNIDGNCPYKPGTYGIYNMKIPPKNFPFKSMNLLNGKFISKLYMLVTKTEELVIEGTLICRIMQ